MADKSTNGSKSIDRRKVLQAGAALAAAGPAVLRARVAEAQPRAGAPARLFAYTGAFTTEDRKGHGGGINVFRIDPASGAWTHATIVRLCTSSPQHR